MMRGSAIGIQQSRHYRRTRPQTRTAIVMTRKRRRWRSADIADAAVLGSIGRLPENVVQVPDHPSSIVVIVSGAVGRLTDPRQWRRQSTRHLRVKQYSGYQQNNQTMPTMVHPLSKPDYFTPHTSPFIKTRRL